MTNPLTETVIKALKIPGITEQGGAWLAKALHPSDAALKCTGIPMDTSLPTAALNFLTTTTVSAPAAAAWQAHIKLNPSPLCFGSIAAATAAAYSFTTVYNPTVTSMPFDEHGAGSVAWL